MRRHYIVNLLLAVSLGLSVFVLEGQMEKPVQAGGLELAGPLQNSSASTGDQRSKLVNALALGFLQRSSEFETTYKGTHEELVDSMKDLVQQALYRDDYTAYVLESYSYKIRTVGRSSTIHMKVVYRETPAQSALVEADSQKVLKEILAPKMSDEEKVLAIHDWIVRHVSYDESMTRYTAYDAMEGHSAVCQGYALLTYRMLSDAGITARIIEGKVASGEHAWNLVRLDGHWYHLDTTWDDPVPDRGDGVRHTYFLLSDRQISKDHSWTREYPAAPIPYLEAY